MSGGVKGRLDGPEYADGQDVRLEPWKSEEPEFRAELEPRTRRIYRVRRLERAFYTTKRAGGGVFDPRHQDGVRLGALSGVRHDHRQSLCWRS
jgi:hypothetical protein